MNWTGNLSVKLTKVFIYLFMAAYVGICGSAPWLCRWFLQLRDMPAEKYPLFLTTIYLAAIPAACVLLELHTLLSCIDRKEIFIFRNVRILRRLSLYCLCIGVICLISGFYYLPFFIFSAAVLFVGLILMVIKNVFAEAVQIKDENDFTI